VRRATKLPIVAGNERMTKKAFVSFLGGSSRGRAARLAEIVVHAIHAGIRRPLYRRGVELS